ncbi:hypothetical protein J1N35_014343 [Gossypium stocksii]|uniref:Uncharacterized protein n=1 Tax=Gossypium stocksii TaxID=47602 RepID=A0A9D3VUS0_9ROSI|nr:hypothetical protein J1N35_014343 [Gossypium stocksii]
MVIERPSDQATTWKDMLVGQSLKGGANDSDGKEVFDILEGDIQRSVVNGVPFISFSDQIHKILLQGMDNTVALTLLAETLVFQFYRINYTVCGDPQVLYT